MPQANALAQTQLRRVVAEQLRHAIHAGELKPGEWLRQEQLAQKFGVSQMPVREALQDLAGEGLVEHVPYRGIRVVHFSLNDLQDLYACRAFMEGMAAGYAAKNITHEELTELEQALQEIEQHPITLDIALNRNLHRRFHQLIYSASRRSYLIHSLNQMWKTFPTMMFSNFPRLAEQPLGRTALAGQEHRAILAALAAHDSERAARLVRQHVEATAQSIVAVIAMEQK